MNRRDRLINDFRELAALYLIGQMNAKISLSQWPVIDEAFHRLGASLGLTQQDVDAILKPTANLTTPEEDIPETPQEDAITQPEDIPATPQEGPIDGVWYPTKPVTSGRSIVENDGKWIFNYTEVSPSKIVVKIKDASTGQPLTLDRNLVVQTVLRRMWNVREQNLVYLHDAGEAITNDNGMPAIVTNVIHWELGNPFKPEDPSQHRTVVIFASIDKLPFYAGGRYRVNPAADVVLWMSTYENTEAGEYVIHLKGSRNDTRPPAKVIRGVNQSDTAQSGWNDLARYNYYVLTRHYLQMGIAQVQKWYIDNLNTITEKALTKNHEKKILAQINAWNAHRVHAENKYRRIFDYFSNLDFMKIYKPSLVDIQQGVGSSRWFQHSYDHDRDLVHALDFVCIANWAKGYERLFILSEEFAFSHWQHVREQFLKETKEQPGPLSPPRHWSRMVRYRISPRAYLPDWPHAEVLEEEVLATAYADALSRAGITTKTNTLPVSPQAPSSSTLQISTDVDTRDNSPLWVARMPERVSREEYMRINAQVKAAGGYWSSFKKGFIFKKDPTEALKSKGLADTLEALHAEALAEDGYLSDASGRRSRLRAAFRELVVLYALVVCSGRLDSKAEPLIDSKFESIGSVVGEDFRELKFREVDACRSRPANEPPVIDETTVVPTNEEPSSRPAIERPLSEADFEEFATPYVLAEISREAFDEWENQKRTITEILTPPDDWSGTVKAWEERVSARVAHHKDQRDKAYARHTATRFRSRLDTDAPEWIRTIVLQRIKDMRTRSQGILPPEVRQMALSALMKEMRESKFYEHFPTPKHVIEGMLDYVDIKAGERVLEPSAGEGNIAESIRERESGASLDVVEYEPLLAKILMLKGFTVVGSDFLAYNKDGSRQYDVIVMNPPFDRGVDIEHVYHAYQMLKPGGRLAAVTSGAAIDGTDEVNYAFREFVSERGSWKMLPPKEYMGPSGVLTNGRQISIVVAVLTITRPANDTFGTAAPQTERADASEGDYVYDTQGAQAYRIVEFVIDAGKPKTIAENISTGIKRTFNGHIRTGARFLAVRSLEEAEALLGADGGGVTRNADGTIKMPSFPPAPKNGAADLKPLRIVTSRAELMPAAPAASFVSKRIASFVNLTPGQIDGIDRALVAMYGPSRSFLLADGTGFGKTLQQLVIAASIVEREKRPVMIFTKSPSIIETSFYEDARKLKISTPNAQNRKDRIVFSGKESAGMSIRRITSINDLLVDNLKPDIYIASYHLFGQWKEDAKEREAVIAWKKTRVDPLEEEFANRRKVLREMSRHMSEAGLQAARDKLNQEQDTDPIMMRYRELQDAVRRKNEEAFGRAGKRLAAIISDEAHAFKNYNPEDFNDGSFQAFRGMVMYASAERGLFATATPADKVEHIRYLKGLNVYKTEQQYMRLMARMGFVWHEPEYVNGALVKRGKFAFDSALPPEYVLSNISRLFENLTMAGSMIKRELSLDNFEARNIMIGKANTAETAALQQALNQLAVIEAKIGKEKRCKASMLNEKKWALEPFKIQKVMEITKREILEGRQVVIFASLVNDSGPSFPTGNPKPCSAVDKPSTVNTLSRELSAMFGEETIGFVTGVRSSDEETLGDDAGGETPCLDCGSATLNDDMSWADEQHEQSFYGTAHQGLGDATQKRRANDIRAFQEGKKRILIATPEAGGTGISLDDTVGNAPRTIIIMTAPFSSVEVVQILGRINRVKTKSPQRAYFLWMDVPVDRRLRDIIASKLRVLGAAVQGEVKKVSVEEAEFASADNAQENYDKHNVDKDGKLRPHSLTDVQVVDGSFLPSNMPFILTHKMQLTNEIEPASQMRVRAAPIRLKSTLRVGGRQALKEWMEEHAGVVENYGIELHSDRYEGSYLMARYNDELWQIMLNFMKPENTRFVMTQRQRFSVGDRVRAATDIIEADAKVGDTGTISRVWERRVRALDRETGKVKTTEDGQIVWNMVYDYMVEFDNGERANNLESWEIEPAVIIDADDVTPEQVANQPVLGDSLTTYRDAEYLPTHDDIPSLSDLITQMSDAVADRVRERLGRRRGS